MAQQPGQCGNSPGAVPFSARAPGSHPAAYAEDPPFLGLAPPPQLLPLRDRTRLAPHMVPWLLPRPGAPGAGGAASSASATHKALARLGASLAARDCLDAKEFFEAAEFYLRARRRVRRPLMLDCCCGHGLAGLLFAAFEPGVLAVRLVDQRRPPSFDRVRAAVVEVAPWADAKVEYHECDLSNTPQLIADYYSKRRGAAAASEVRGEVSSGGSGGVGVLGVHACGRATDAVLAVAVDARAAVALLPCCYTGTAAGAPLGVRRAFGVAAAADVGRSYALQAAGYTVDWSAIPRAVTPMNRILIAEPPNERPLLKSERPTSQ